MEPHTKEVQPGIELSLSSWIRPHMKTISELFRQNNKFHLCFVNLTCFWHLFLRGPVDPYPQ